MSGARRVVVVGNSGSGKSSFAKALGLPHLDLDTLAWTAGEPPARTPLDEAGRRIEQFALENESGWVIEGCYADLAQVALPLASELVFLDLPVQRCQAHARARPWEPHKYPSKEAQDANLEMLLGWIAGYPEREGPLGRAAHVALYEEFGGAKERRTD